jgi:hypothetical protein
MHAPLPSLVLLVANAKAENDLSETGILFIS